MAILYNNDPKKPKSSAEIVTDMGGTVSADGNWFEVPYEGRTLSLRADIPNEVLQKFSGLVANEKDTRITYETEKDKLAEKRKKVDELEEIVMADYEKNKRVDLETRLDMLPARYCNTADSSCALWSTSLNKKAGLMPKVIRGTKAVKGNLEDWGFQKVEYDPTDPEKTPDIFQIERYMEKGEVQEHQGKPYMDRVENPDGSVTLVKGDKYYEWEARQKAKPAHWAPGHQGNVVGYDDKGNLIVRDSNGRVTHFDERTYSADKVQHGWTKNKSGTLGNEGLGRKNRIVLYRLLGDLPQFKEKFDNASRELMNFDVNTLSNYVGLMPLAPDLLPETVQSPQNILPQTQYTGGVKFKQKHNPLLYRK